jgi:hypothetical protein
MQSQLSKAQVRASNTFLILMLLSVCAAWWAVGHPGRGWLWSSLGLLFASVVFSVAMVASRVGRS